MKGPERIETARLVLRRAIASDAESIFARYSSDRDVTKYLGWPRHESIEQTRAFLRFSDAEWQRWPAGPYLIERRDDARLIGSTGLAFDTDTVASTGYLLARDAWGLGYAIEALAMMSAVAQNVGVCRLYALCHPDNSASVRVLEKCGFVLEDRIQRFAAFPNLASGHEDCLRYARLFT